MFEITRPLQLVAYGTSLRASKVVTNVDSGHGLARGKTQTMQHNEVGCSALLAVFVVVLHH